MLQQTYRKNAISHRKSPKIFAPVSGSIQFFLLIRTLEERLEYNTIGSLSAILVYYEKVDDMPLGQHPLVTSLMAGIFDSRSLQPWYIFAWGVQVILKFIKKDWGISSSLSDRN